jgi:glutathione synthase/RimK-type ligase-like ATP-grasp enzyme
MTQGVIGSPADPQVVSVADRLRALGVEPVVLDLSCFPSPGAISLLDGVPRVSGVDIGSVAAWYVRSFPLPLPFHPMDQEIGDPPARSIEELIARSDRAYAAGRERRSFLFSFAGALERAGAALVNPPARFSQHFLKLDQLDRLRQAGIPVPRTLGANDPEAVVEFARTLGGSIVYKPVAGGGLCRRASEDDLGADRLALLATAPVLFQEEIPGRNIRAYVVGGRVVASYEIVSEELDYRGAETSVVVTPLTEKETDSSCRAARACELTFTGLDIRRRPDGTFAVLECNPSPMFSAIERMTGATPISQALADHLISC